MIDLDIPTNTPPATNTLAHWIQTGLTPATAATTLNTTRGTIQAFLLENKGNTAAIAPYFGPSPPARIPLSHRYTQILVDTSSITAQGLQTLSTAVNASRVGFNAGTVLAQASLAGKVVAGNFYNVTNPGPVQAAVTNTTAATTTTSGAATGTAAFLPGTGTSTSGTALPTAAAADLRSSCAALGIVVVGAVMFGL
ncbi:hypothetical protein B0T24DRAFT_624259 [Lasiosphaeria ovina]|uniref:PEBP-like protein n=1 Tax=Lasiosphaeria ovina TaxID=92902 RepID=A0AAE0KC12_9PEZI|nr:hypothetical protein B0T24DRAFT_624259 [Lasiosphaeria ovina]